MKKAKHFEGAGAEEFEARFSAAIASAFQPLMELVMLGFQKNKPRIIQELKQILSDPKSSILAPRATVEQFRNLIKICVPAQSSDVPDALLNRTRDSWENLCVLLESMPRDIKSKVTEEDQKDIKKHECGPVMFQFLMDARSTLGDKKALPIIEEVLDSKLSNIFTSNVLLPAVFYVDGKVPPFEVLIGSHVEHLYNFAEEHYKKMLKSALNLSYLMKGKPLVGDVTLGALMSKCRDQWKTAGPLNALDPKIRIIRNAVAHKSFEIKVEAKKILFVNKTPDGRQEKIGPWNINTFMKYYRQFFRRGAALNRAFYSSRP